MLEYSRIRDYAPASKLKWIVIAGAVLGLCGLISDLTNFALYFAAPLFPSMGSSMGRPGRTDYAAMAIEVGFALLMGWLGVSAIAFLRGYPARRHFAMAAWALLFAHAISAVYFHFKYYIHPGTPLAAQVIQSTYEMTNFVTFNLPVALIILFFGQRQTALRLSELSTPVAFAAEAPQPGRTPDSP